MDPQRLVSRLQAARNPPGDQYGVDLLGNKVSGALAIVPLFQQFLVFGEHVPRISDERQPSGRFRGRRSQTRTVDRMVRNGTEFVRRNSRREPPQRRLDIGALCQCITLTRPDPIGIDDTPLCSLDLSAFRCQIA
jgi:hypothetical protein